MRRETINNRKTTMNINADEYQDNYKQDYLDNGDLLDNEHHPVNGEPEQNVSQQLLLTYFQTQMSSQHKHEEDNQEQKDNG